MRVTGTPVVSYITRRKLEHALYAVSYTHLTPVISIKNPYAGRITAPAVGEIIRDDENAMGEVVIDGRLAGETVSYTHLDVYKRQRLWHRCAHSGCFP